MADETQTTSQDPNAARMAIMARIDAGTQAEIEVDREQHPEIEDVAAAFEGGDEPSTDVEEHVDTPPSGEAPADDPGAQGGDVGAQGDDSEVTLTVFGQPIIMLQSDVDRRGGVAAAQMQLAADYRFNQATTLANHAKALLNHAEEKNREADRLAREISERNNTAAPATGAVQGDAATHRGEPDEAIRATAKKLVGAMFQGEESAIEAAVLEVMSAAPRSTTSAEDIANLVLARVESQRLADEGKRAEKQAADAAENERLEVNALMRDKYAAIMADTDLVGMTHGLFAAAKSDPRNKGRSQVSIIDEVAAHVLSKTGLSPATNTDVASEISARKNSKRRIPSPSLNSDRAPSGEPPSKTLTASEFVNMQRVARGQPAQ